MTDCPLCASSADGSVPLVSGSAVPASANHVRGSAYAEPVKQRVVVVEDDDAIGSAVIDSLVAHGYAGVLCRTGADALQVFAVETPDLVILDIGLPDTDGFTLCRALRRQFPELPILMVTARDAEIDIVVGLDSGATDYITKPFSMNVLLARVRAHLRQNSPRVAAAINVGRLTVEPAAYLAEVDGEPIELRRREFELLLALVRDAGKVVTRERLLADIWDLHWESSTKTLDMHVMALRRKLGTAVAITTVRGVGYRLSTV
jgi:DNA-binding response OmpR family regulator